LAGGGTDFGLSDSFGSGHSDMFQTAIYARKDFNAAYLSAALAYAWHGVSTDRSLIVGGADRFTAAFTAQNVAAEIEAGYRVGWFTPYAALREQAFYTPAYSESTASGSPLFALAYEARSTTTTRTELGIKFDRTITLGNGMKVGLRTRTAWVHDYWSNRNVVAMFQSLPGSSFAVTGAAPASDSLLVSAGAEMRMGRGFSLAGWFDGEFARDSQTYGGSVKLRHTW
jgi:outer membrane autotransporter protein